MKVMIRALVLALIIIREGNGSGPFVQEALARVFGPWNPSSNIRIIQLLNQLCNESQLDDEIKKDACYGCFFRASSQPNGYPMLLNMASCADIYLNNTNYGHCQNYLRNATNSVSTRTNPGIVYCSFIECIRQANKDILEAYKDSSIDERGTKTRELLTPRWNYGVKGRSNISKKFHRRVIANPLRKLVCVIVNSQRDILSTIKQCVVETVGMFSTSFNCSDNNQLAQLFVNATACVLAKTRCIFPNPVTGAVQNAESIYGKFDKIVTVNALQVNTDYDLNIIRLPFLNPVKNDECGQFRNVEQAGWPSVDC